MSNLDRLQQSLDERDADSNLSPRRNRSSHLRTDSFTSRIPTLSPRNGERSRVTFTKTRTLTGAFEATAGRSSASDNSKRSPRQYTIEGNGKKPSVTSPASRASSPRNEFVETYRRTDDTDNLPEHLNENDLDLLSRRERDEQMFNCSPSPGVRHRDIGMGNYAGNTYGYEPDDLEQVSDEDLRRRSLQRKKDEQRLKRMRGGEQPAFSRARMGSKAALSVDNLTRRDEEIQREEEGVEDGMVDEGRNPPLNIPRTWGTRSRATNDWLNRTKQEVQGDYMADAEELELYHDSENDVFDFTGQSLQISNSPPVRNGPQYQQEVQKLEPIGQPVFAARSPPKQQETKPSRSEVENGSPAVIPTSMDYEKPKVLSKEDSQDLLRRLVRKESPSITNTPETKVVSNTPLNPKTPVVMGAWIDTPLTKRPNNPPEEASKAALPPREAPPKLEPEPVEEKKEPSPKEVRRKRTSLMKLERPHLPKSALAAVLEEVKSGKGEFALGGNTIESLEELLESSSTSSIESKPSKKVENIEQNALEQIRADQESEEALIDRLNSKLQSLVQNINEAKAGLVSLEDKAVKEAALLATRQSQDFQKTKSHIHRDGTCESCGFHDDGLRYVAIPIPRIWRRDPDTGRQRLTRLGWSLIIIFIWQIFEAIIETYRYHPSFLNKPRFIASRDPEWPTAIPHTIWRWLHLSAIWVPIRDTIFSCVRYVGVSLGMWDRLFDDWMYGDEWYGENWIQRYNHDVYPEFFRREPLAQGHFRPNAAWEPGGGGDGITGGGVGVGADPDLSMNADTIL
ncbi:hypothetical protein D8B26_003184 [Coccidioides posadasii str. Silveira]|uniref:Uncharacterized protein n=1 Tax=Coccidioides posadasii (strain RMSCC 757 / Silveira) TaxID=443226 RepID=E9CYZ0_COCPS|nr:conserved hypothetical protein [Coccidioides posadasii str. Silveira]QVM08495.1 hypothetical protein D8B26_003184 [Coccidioides posadasii str. Silveira]